MLVLPCSTQCVQFYTTTIKADNNKIRTKLILLVHESSLVVVKYSDFTNMYSAHEHRLYFCKATQLLAETNILERLNTRSFKNSEWFKRWQRPTSQKLHIARPRVLQPFSLKSSTFRQNKWRRWYTAWQESISGTIHTLHSIPILSTIFSSSSLAHFQNVSAVICMRLFP